MSRDALGFGGGFTAPHAAATQAGRDILRAGGNAVEAMVAAAAVIAVTYPHMNAIGGDGFWLIRLPGQAAPVAVQGCGFAGALATVDWYAAQGHDRAIPTRGPLAALTVPGAVAGWARALEVAGGHLPRTELMAQAVTLARDGFAVTANQADLTRAKLSELAPQPGFADQYLPGGVAPLRGQRLAMPRLAETLDHLGRAGWQDFYRGDIAQAQARTLDRLGSPVTAADFAAMQGRMVEPVTVQTSAGQLWNQPAPTQGGASALILALQDRLPRAACDSADYVHGLVEATKQAFLLRDAELGDAATMARPVQDWLSEAQIAALMPAIDMGRALPWPRPSRQGDTIWMGAADAQGMVVSYIQSIYWEFGSGVTCGETGVLFQNRGAGFSLAPGANQLAPGKRPFHTLNPAMARLADGRWLSYGTMGGEGQPQTQAALFTRHVQHGLPLAEAIARPRWLLGRTWGAGTTTLKLEDRFDPAVIAALAARGHAVEVLGPWEDTMGHAGAVALSPDGLIDAASDPRADGAALAF